MLILTLFAVVTCTQSVKTIRSQHPNRRLNAKPERKLFNLFGSSSTDTELDDRNEHKNMVLVMNMMQKNTLINNILKNVKLFSNALDDLSESVNTQIVQLAAVANSNLSKNLYISKI